MPAPSWKHKAPPGRSAPPGTRGTADRAAGAAPGVNSAESADGGHRPPRLVPRPPRLARFPREPRTAPPGPAPLLPNRLPPSPLKMRQELRRDSQSAAPLLASPAHPAG